jgi:tetratricopeptide (TPR) repeat protein
MRLTRKYALIPALVAPCLFGGMTAATAAGWQKAASEAASKTEKACPSPQEVKDALGNSSALMEQAKYQDVIEVLQPLSDLNCDAHVNLLLAGALEGSGDLRKAEDTLQRAHSVWPLNNSIAASLAREYMSSGEVDKALQALDKFHATVTTPMQEMEEGVVVYLAGHRLKAAQAVAEVAYKCYPSVHSLLLLANVLQLQGRYKDVNLLFQSKRVAYADSAAFLITFAESEYDAMLYDDARKDLEHAISLDRDSYQAHFLLGNVLLAQGETDQAAAEYRVAIGLAPDQPRTYYQLALVSRTKQDDEGEEHLLSQALAADGRYAPAYCEMGRIMITQHRLPDAVDRLNLAIQYNPQIEQAYYLLARAYAGLGEKDKSDAMVKQYTKIRSANRQSSVDKRPGQRGADPAAAP